MIDNSSDDHFKQFAQNLERAIDKYGDLSEESLIDRQRRQIETLVGLEKKFRKTLIAHRYGAATYKAFVQFICEKNRNILSARPYFRERQSIFTEQISRALKKRAEKSLYKFHFNFNFVQFVLRSRKWHSGSPIVKIAKQIKDIRTEIVEMNMPLAISRARIFWSRTPKAQLSYMDLIQISCEGLMSAVDKFVLPFSPVFRSVAIGRMVGNFIENYSETMVHFFPVDKRKIYRANKVIHKYGDNVDFDKLAEEVNNGVDSEHHTTPEEIAGLMAASSCVSSDANAGTPNKDEEDVARLSVSNVARVDPELHPDTLVEQNDAMRSMYDAMEKLSVVEKKLLQMRGVPLP